MEVEVGSFPRPARFHAPELVAPPHDDAADDEEEGDEGHDTDNRIANMATEELRVEEVDLPHERHQWIGAAWARQDRARIWIDQDIGRREAVRQFHGEANDSSSSVPRSRAVRPSPSIFF